MWNWQLLEVQSSFAVEEARGRSFGFDSGGYKEDLGHSVRRIDSWERRWGFTRLS